MRVVGMPRAPFSPLAQLQENWDAAQAAQDPYLKSGREQPWDVVEGSVPGPISPEVWPPFCLPGMEIRLTQSFW